MHRDIKTSNILLDQGLRAKVLITILGSESLCILRLCVPIFTNGWIFICYIAQILAFCITLVQAEEAVSTQVADFGLARLVERSNVDDVIATHLEGTPGYIPPE